MAGTWLPKTATLSVWALAALCAAYWVFRFTEANTAPVAVPTVASAAPVSDPADLAKVFGPALAIAAAPAASLPKAIDPSTRFMLLGVVADRANVGVALISVEGKVARPYRVGSPVDETYLLKSVALRSATLAPLSQGGGAFTLELARTAAPAPAGAPPMGGSAGSPFVAPLIPVPNQALPPLRAPRPARNSSAAA